MNILKRAILILFNSIKFKRIAFGCGLVSTGARVVGARRIVVGQGSFIGKNGRIEYHNCANGAGGISIGANNHFGWQCSLLAGERIEIGDDNLFASQILITDIAHGMNAGMVEPYHAQQATCKPVMIGNGNWIGEKVSILPGVNIGDRCVIGANSVVTKDVPSYSIAVGMPAKVVKRWDFEGERWKSVEQTQH